MINIEKRLANIVTRIKQSAQRAERDANEISLLAVSKSHSTDAIRILFDLGVTRFGESYVQEATNKMQLLKDCAIEWHFIGPIQSNKTQQIAIHFDWVHSVDRIKIAKRLNDQRPAHMPPLNICLQVNISGETTKSGLKPEEIELLIDELRSLSHIKIRGLMAIPQFAEDEQLQRKGFNKMFALFERVKSRYRSLDTLSMGMTNDFEAAILEGATIIRVGSGLFGKRS